MGRIRKFFREKFTVVRARLAITNIKGLIRMHKNYIKDIDDEIIKLKIKRMNHVSWGSIYQTMLSDLRKELNNES